MGKECEVSHNIWITHLFFELWVVTLLIRSLQTSQVWQVLFYVSMFLFTIHRSSTAVSRSHTFNKWSSNRLAYLVVMDLFTPPFLYEKTHPLKKYDWDGV